MFPPKNQLSTHVSENLACEPTGHHSLAQALNHLTKLTEDLSDSLHRAINVARPHLVMDPRDVDKASVGSEPTPLASPFCHEIRSVNTRLECLLELLTRFGSNFDT
jgi:hypothetical protein